jgi:catechol 2,3-dioxygenase-like lactoylglutathione lyase family enzyme
MTTSPLDGFRCNYYAIKRHIQRARLALDQEMAGLATCGEGASRQLFLPGLAAMSDHAETTPAKAVIAGAEPQLFVADIRASCEFFTSKLGFVTAFTYGEPPFYAQVARDGARINLRCVEQPVIDAGLRDREQLLSASLTVATSEEIKALFLEFQAAGVPFFQSLKRQPWGARDFILKDPDGNLLLFAGPAE